MKYRRIHIIGGPGGGKTYLAAKIAETYKIDVCNLDDIFWNNNTEAYGLRMNKADRDFALLQILKKDSWIVEGCYYEWLRPCFEKADVIIILTPSVGIRDWRIILRFLKRKLHMIESKKKENFSSLWSLLKWNHKYDSDNLQKARKFIGELNCMAVECKTEIELFGILRS